MQFGSLLGFGTSTFLKCEIKLQCIYSVNFLAQFNQCPIRNHFYLKWKPGSIHRSQRERLGRIKLVDVYKCRARTIPPTSSVLAQTRLKSRDPRQWPRVGPDGFVGLID